MNGINKWNEWIFHESKIMNEGMHEFAWMNKRIQYISLAIHHNTSLSVLIAAFSTDALDEGTDPVPFYRSPLFCLWMFSAFASSCYTLMWDLKMDWGLLEKESFNKLLRDEIVYPEKVRHFSLMQFWFSFVEGAPFHEKWQKPWTNKLQVPIQIHWVEKLKVPYKWQYAFELIIYIHVYLTNLWCAV